MGMTFLQQQNKLSRILGDSNTTTDDQWPLADRKEELNRGEIQFARDTKALLGYATSTISSQAISLPSDWIETFKMSVTIGGSTVVVTDKNEISITDLERYLDSGGTYFYFWVNSSGTRQYIFVSSESDGETYKIWYYAKPSTTLNLDADESVFPDEYREASVYYAASELLEQIGKSDLASVSRSKYQFFVDKAREDYEKHYINTQPPVPDLSTGNVFDTNTQGIGSADDYRIF